MGERLFSLPVITVPRCRGRRLFHSDRLEPLDHDPVGAVAGLPQIVSHLHTEPCFRARPERLRQADGHIDRDTRVAVDEVGKESGA